MKVVFISCILKMEELGFTETIMPLCLPTRLLEQYELIVT